MLMTRKKIIEQALIDCETNGEYLAKNVSGEDLAYLRTWANRKGYYLTKQDKDALISIKKTDKVRAHIRESIAIGKGFSISHPVASYIRNVVSEINKNLACKWVVTEKDGKFIIYPDPAESILNKTELI